MDSRLDGEVSITDLFDQFIEASTMRNVLSIHHRILNYADLNPCEFNVFFPKLKRAVMANRLRKNWKAKALFSKIDKKASHKCYSNTKAAAATQFGINRSALSECIVNNSQDNLDDNNLNSSSQTNRIYFNNNALQNYNCLIIGSGPAGLRTAIELQLLGASRVVVVEKRSRFSRNNVLHLWPFVIDDLKSLGAKKFYGKFCAGSIDHISIRQLQLILLKISLMIGCDFRDSCSYINLCPSSIKQINNNNNTTVMKQQQQQQMTITTENNSDNKNADSKCDYNTEFINSKCDFNNVLEEANNDNFIKVSNENTNLENSIMEDITNKEEESNIESNNFVISDSMLVHEGSLQMNKDDNNFNLDEINYPLQEGIKSDSITLSDKNNSSTTDRSSSILTNDLQVQQPKLRRGDHLRGVQAHFQSEYSMQEKELHSIEWDIIVGADGRRNTLNKFFPRKEFRGRLAIAITANFINRQTPAEASVSEISGLSFIYNQDMFNALAYDTNIQLENICYYKDDTHYFVMTAKKKSLLERGVLKKDFSATHDLLSDENVDKQALLKYAKDAAYWTTGLEPLDFALNHYGQEDCAMFDFTSMYAASNACKALRTKEGGLTLISLVGDSLLEPFWPTGSGCARGFLSSFDAAWMCRQWAVNKCAVVDYHFSNNNYNKSNNRNNNRSIDITNNKSIEPTTHDGMALSVMAERESIYRVLAQTTSENLHQNYSHWTLNPHTRYPNLNRHLIVPSQVEHLITDNENQKINNLREKSSKHNSNNERSMRRIKSPFGSSNRKSPKKLKSGKASPLMNQSLTKQNKLNSPRFKSEPRQSTINNRNNKIKQDLDLDDIYLEFNESYNDLNQDQKLLSKSYYNNRRQKPNCEIYDDYFIPSISGTLPSSNNLMSLEARRARDIDECLRQRRQKTQISAVRDELINQFKRNSTSEDRSTKKFGDVGQQPCGAALFNELRKLKEQQAKMTKENNSRDINGPLSLLNSMRRCASFAERVKSFESKIGGNESITTPSTPKIPIDNVKNLPEFSTLQELFVNNSTNNTSKEPIKKVKMPIMKLSKDDWNVKCWEKRLAAYKQRNSLKDASSSTKSLNKALSVDSSYQNHLIKPEKQIEVFKGRIKEMADKLKQVEDKGLINNNNSKLQSNRFVGSKSNNNNESSRPGSGTWVSHLRKELTKGVEAKRPQQVIRQQAMNPVVPSKPIKKLFQDDDDDEDDGKHFDHLCINRPTNKYLPKNKYSGHLVRTKFNSSTSKVINRNPTKESKQAYLNALTSRGSSASSTLSDYSTATGGSSSGGGGGCNTTISSNKQQSVVLCFRCDELINLNEKITIGQVSLHRNCLTCSACGITLRTNELQHYLNFPIEIDASSEKTKNRDFVCVICEPNMRMELNREAADRLIEAEFNTELMEDKSKFSERQLRSREEFLNQKINYNEIYKNIIDCNNKVLINGDKDKEKDENINDEELTVQNVKLDSIEYNSQSKKENCDKKTLSNDNYPQHDDRIRILQQDNDRSNISPSPVSVTLPLNLIKSIELEEINTTVTVDDEQKRTYTIARSETIDGSEQVTLVLPAESDSFDQLGRASSPPRPMIDEEEFHRILHLDGNKSTSDKNIKNEVDDSSDDDDSDTSSEEIRKDYNNKHDDCKISSESSSLNSPQNSDSTYEDFSTSEEFGLPSEDENGSGEGEGDGHDEKE